MEKSTHFANWCKDGLPDPHGEFYNGDKSAIAMGDIPSSAIARALTIRQGHDYSFIALLTAGKEHLRWLSRKLYALAKNHEEINIQRAKLRAGDLTDDQLANAFYLSESADDLKAGQDRIVWLENEIAKIESLSDETKTTK